MIRSFRNRVAEDIFHGSATRFARKLPKSLHGKAQRLLDQLNAATIVETLRIPPGNRLEKLKGDLNGYWSSRVNEQWRVIFRWENGDAFDVGIVDYH